MRTQIEGNILLLLFSLFFNLVIATSTDTINATGLLRDGDSIISANGTFELGFFSLGSSMNRYLGIWYKEIGNGTVAWVANREVPLMDRNGVLKIIEPGVLALFNHNGSKIWSTNSSRSAQFPVVQLLDSGNLVVRDGNDGDPENYLWQSFDYPGDTLLPGLKLGWNRTSGLERYLSSWKSADDPSMGDYRFRFDPSGYPQLLVMKGSVENFRTGPWNGLRFSGTPELRPNPIYKFEFVFNEEEIYYKFELHNLSVVSRLILSPPGIVQRFTWIVQTQRWKLYLTVQLDDCDTYALCGAYGSCTISNSPMCECLKGFVPKFPNEWDRADWSNGCVHRTPLECGKGDGFRKYSGVKLPDTRYSMFNTSTSLKECKIGCLKNCSCTAYANLDIREGGSGCLLWFGDLIDIRQLTENGQDLYIRMAQSELDKAGNNLKKMIGIILGAVIFAGVLAFGVFYVRKKKRMLILGKTGESGKGDYINESHKDDLDLPLFDFVTIANATDNFSVNNKLGEGGFGPVYKDSRQGLDEFKNEVIFIAKLQHRNLVKLLGCCIQGEEKILIYEYMPNNSLDYFIFNKMRCQALNWPKRFQIINGIARGLLYLHQDSRLRIIHRDLKASNILLDKELDPKISDFGMARCFGGNETAANTKRVVGTGYMSPEYAIDGLFSVKSDVFSFGVLLLEIVTGKRNRGFHHPDHELNLLGHAWTLFLQKQALELLDPSIQDSYILSEVLQSIHVGLLCVQHRPEDRPSMSSVILMLGSQIPLPQPKQPGFFTERKLFDSDSSSSKYNLRPSNSMTLTLPEPRWYVSCCT
ncbi:S-locus glycoprotein domain [Dillenia turbinata]|uniref:Receptor-like serine/threonine-protein kinase n=1 Tax=Dillenia turbinata TaxID=194707 RepID=A0AAN8VRA9_9MAGN